MTEWQDERSYRGRNFFFILYENSMHVRSTAVNASGSIYIPWPPTQCSPLHGVTVGSTQEGRGELCKVRCGVSACVWPQDSVQVTINLETTPAPQVPHSRGHASWFPKGLSFLSDISTPTSANWTLGSSSKPGLFPSSLLGNLTGSSVHVPFLNVWGGHCCSPISQVRRPRPREGRDRS